MKTSTLAKIIADQAQYLKTDNIELLYDEITNFLNNNNLSGFDLVEFTIKNPQKILRSNNFQYLIDGISIEIKNKFFN